MARFSEPLFGGLWTAEDPAFLEPGQLSGMQNAVYDPDQSALSRATGRSQFGAVSATGTSATAINVDGLRDIQFDNGDHYLVAMTPSSYATAAVGDTGTFSSASAITGGNALERVHYRNRYFLLNGVTAEATAINTNKTFYLSATAASNPLQIRQHGMLPVNGMGYPSAAVASTFSQTVTGYYEYWVTEVAELTQDGALLSLESAFSSDTNPLTCFVSSTGMSPSFPLPLVRNGAITTKYNIYRSPKKDKESDKQFPIGFLVGTVSTAASSFVDTIATASASSLPTVAQTTGQFTDWTAASALTASGGGLAFVTGIGISTKSQGTYGYSFGGFSGTVKGIEVVVSGAVITGTPTANGVPVQATIGIRDAGTNGFKGLLAFPPGTIRVASKSGTLTATGAGRQNITLGSPTDRWLGADAQPFSDTEFNAASAFMVVLGVSKLNYQVAVDAVQVKLYYAASIDGTVQYPAVVYTFGDILAQVSKNHPPPNASTGDLFEDMLVLNDTTNPALIRYSFAGEPEYFPPTYFIDFETTENDRVTNIKVVNNVLVVGLETSLWRVNTLPTERDSEFSRGRAIEVISRTYGCVNEMCAAVYSKPGYGDRLAFVSNSGIFETDGFSFEALTDGINWRNHISTTSTSSPIALINDPDKQELLFYYRNDAITNETYQCLHLHYGSHHLTNGKPKVSGPVHMRNYHSTGPTRASLESAWTVGRASGQTSVYLGYGGTATAAGGGYVYRETGTTIPAEDDRMAYVTRRMYQADMSKEWTLENLYGYAGSYSGTPQLSYFVEKTKTNDTGPVTSSAKSITLGGQKLHRVAFSEGSEGMRVSAIITASAYSQHQLVIESGDWAEEDAGT